MKVFSFSKTLLISLPVFLAAGAFYGGLPLVIRPNGSILRMPVEILSGSTVGGFLMSGWDYVNLHLLTRIKDQ